jgi:hypothetical protein
MIDLAFIGGSEKIKDPSIFTTTFYKILEKPKISVDEKKVVKSGRFKDPDSWLLLPAEAKRGLSTEFSASPLWRTYRQ